MQTKEVISFFSSHLLQEQVRVSLVVFLPSLLFPPFFLLLLSTLMLLQHVRVSFVVFRVQILPLLNLLPSVPYLLLISISLPAVPLPPIYSSSLTRTGLSIARSIPSAYTSTLESTFSTTVGRSSVTTTCLKSE